jgi:hypothetical protein
VVALRLNKALLIQPPLRQSIDKKMKEDGEPPKHLGGLIVEIAIEDAMKKLYRPEELVEDDYGRIFKKI